MAPEQLEAREADARSDIFAFGAVLYEMLTGRRAFEGKSQASLIAAILEHEPPSLSTLQPLTPAGLDRLVRTCLAKDPDARWQSARDLERELAWIADSSPVSVGRCGRATLSETTNPCRERADPRRWCTLGDVGRHWPFAVDDVATATCGHIASVAQRSSGRSASLASRRSDRLLRSSQPTGDRVVTRRANHRVQCRPGQQAAALRAPSVATGRHAATWDRGGLEPVLLAGWAISGLLGRRRTEEDSHRRRRRDDAVRDARSFLARVGAPATSWCSRATTADSGRCRPVAGLP